MDHVQAEHLKYGGRGLAIHMSVALTAFLRHALVPQQWLKSFIVPIIKDKKGTLQTQIIIVGSRFLVLRQKYWREFSFRGLDHALCQVRNSLVSRKGIAAGIVPSC